MWPFGRDARDRALDEQSARIADLKQQNADMLEEKRLLLDRIMALTNPAALREVHRQLPKAAGATVEALKNPKPQSHRFPGNEVMVLPTRRPEPPAPFPPEPSKTEAS